MQNLRWSADKAIMCILIHWIFCRYAGGGPARPDGKRIDADGAICKDKSFRSGAVYGESDGAYRKYARGV